MIDLTQTTRPKSDQLNADDLIGKTMTIKVTNVSLCAGTEQPIAINFEGDECKPYKPCKSMRRVLIAVWGSDGAAYAGQRMTIYRDDKVQFGGQSVGGIRISHMSGLTEPRTLALTETRAKRKPFVVKPLEPEPVPAKKDMTPDALAAAANGTESLKAFWNGLDKGQRAALAAIKDQLKAKAEEADRVAEDMPPPPPADYYPDSAA